MGKADFFVDFSERYWIVPSECFVVCGAISRAVRVLYRGEGLRDRYDEQDGLYVKRERLPIRYPRPRYRFKWPTTTLRLFSTSLYRQRCLRVSKYCGPGVDHRLQSTRRSETSVGRWRRIAGTRSGESSLRPTIDPFGRNPHSSTLSSQSTNRCSGRVSPHFFCFFSSFHLDLILCGL